MKKNKWDRFDAILDRIGIASLQAMIFGGLALWIGIIVIALKEFLFV
jgi:hypothetical protein